ncbi:MAG: acyltransferase [Proteobacteria bacterium]|nr:acyltransferase [Pseudomonadota bacterium]
MSVSPLVLFEKIMTYRGYHIYMNIIMSFLRRLCYSLLYTDLLQEHIKRGLIVGKNFKMQNEVIIDPTCTWLIEIGDNVTLAPRVNILAHDASMKKHLNYARIGKVKIGDRVFIGAGAVILPGVTIGNNVVVGAGSIVSRDIADGQVVAGNPARVICTLDDFLERKRNEMMVCPSIDCKVLALTDEMKKEMNAKMKDNIGYII